MQENNQSEWHNRQLLWTPVGMKGGKKGKVRMGERMFFPVYTTALFPPIKQEHDVASKLRWYMIKETFWHHEQHFFFWLINQKHFSGTVCCMVAVCTPQSWRLHVTNSPVWTQQPHWSRWVMSVWGNIIHSFSLPTFSQPVLICESLLQRTAVASLFGCPLQNLFRRSWVLKLWSGVEQRVTSLTRLCSKTFLLSDGFNRTISLQPLVQ